MFLRHYVEKGDSENLSKAFHVLKEEGLIELKTALNWSPLIDIHIQKGDLETAVQEFERIAKEEGKLPHKFKLMQELIEKEDMENMQRVLDASIEVIGETKSLYDLVLNFLKVEKYPQAKKLLETPGLRYDQDKVSYIMHKLAQDNALDELENFVALSQSIFACDREFMYSTLVSTLEQVKEAVRINDVWVNMQEEDFVPSEELKIQCMYICLLYTSPSPRDATLSRMPSSA